MTPSETVHSAGDPVRLPRRKLPTPVDVALPAVAIGSGAMLFLAVPNLIDGAELVANRSAARLHRLQQCAETAR